MVYKVAFLRADREIETLYWEGSLDETISLARSVAFECGFEEFRIIESKPVRRATGRVSPMNWGPRRAADRFGLAFHRELPKMAANPRACV
jgi:hypothetical protein